MLGFIVLRECSQRNFDYNDFTINEPSFHHISSSAIQPLHEHIAYLYILYNLTRSKIVLQYLTSCHCCNSIKTKAPELLPLNGPRWLCECLVNQPRNRKANMEESLKFKHQQFLMREDHVVWSKAPEQPLNGPCGEIVLSVNFWQTMHWKRRKVAREVCDCSFAVYNAKLSQLLPI